VAELVERPIGERFALVPVAIPVFVAVSIPAFILTDRWVLFPWVGRSTALRLLLARILGLSCFERLAGNEFFIIVGILPD